MTNPKLLAIKASIYEMGLRFNQQPSPERIEAYAIDLMEFTPAQVTYAFRQVINSGSAFFTSLAEVLKHLRPAMDQGQDRAPQVANEMLNALRTYGPHDEENMLKNVSEEARLAFSALGYTGHIRNSENIDTVRAQLERLARSVISSRENAQKNNQLEKIGIVLPMKKPGMKKLDFNSFLPSEG
jgi:hypothetical protein